MAEIDPRASQSGHFTAATLPKPRSVVSELKQGAPPLGGAPPIPQGKLAGLAVAAQGMDFFGGQELPVMEAPGQLQGVGSAYAVNQAVSSGQTNGPVSLAEAQRIKPAAPQAPQEGVIDAKAEAASEKEVVEGSRLPDFDLDALEAARNPLSSPERRKIIESRLGPLAIEDLILQREISQVVPVLPRKFEVTLRTFSQREHLFCLSYVYEFQGSPQYVVELFNTAKIVCSFVAINSRPLPEHRKNVGERNEEVDRAAFDAKMAIVTALPIQVLADISVQAQWFHERVNKLFTVENVKNG